MASLLASTLLFLSVVLLYPLVLLCAYLFSRVVATRAPSPSPPSAPASSLMDASPGPASYGTPDDTPRAVAVSPVAEDRASSPPSLIARGGGLCRAIPLPPPVLIMLLTGITVRALLDSQLPWVRFLFGSWMTDKTTHGSGAATTTTTTTGATRVDAAGRRQARFLAWLLSLSYPFMLLALATIAQNIGSHLSYAQLSRLRRPLALFLCCFFPIVYIIMLGLYNGVAGPLFGLNNRQSALEHGVDALVASSMAASSSMDKSDSAEAAMRDVHRAAEAVVSFHQVYLRRTAWTFALVAATVTLERSSPEFLSAMQNTGVTSGLVPVFTLCIAACQDVFALFAFIVFSAMASSRQTAASLTLSEKISDLRTALRHLAAPGASPSAADGFGRKGHKAVIAHRRSTGQQLVLIFNATIGAVLTALLVRRLCFFLVSGGQGTDGWRRRRRHMPSSTRQFPSSDVDDADLANADDTQNNADNKRNQYIAEDGEEPVSGSPLFSSRAGDPSSAPPSPDALACSSATYVFLATIGLALVLWEMVTPCELLLAAVFTGAAINFYTPCPYFEAGMKATQTLCNTVLFTTMGLRTSFAHTRRSTASSSSSSSSSSSATEGSDASPLIQRWQAAVQGPSAGAVIAWGVLFFVVRVFACWLGGLVGGYAALHFGGASRAESATETVTKSTSSAPTTAVAMPASTATAPAAAAALPDKNTIVEEKVAREGGVHWYIGFALLTQLAIALTLNQRGTEEYDERMHEILPTPGALFLATSASTTTATRKDDLDKFFSFSLEESLLSMLPLTQGYMVAIVCAMLVGPVLGAWYLRKVGAMANRTDTHHD